MRYCCSQRSHLDRPQAPLLHPLTLSPPGTSAARQAIINFVTRVTTEGGKDFVPPKDRIATFDNDGTLWCEQPIYVQSVFAFDLARAMAAQNPVL